MERHDRELLLAIERVDIEPGDVIMTGSRDPVSIAIQRATGSTVSHVVVAVGDGKIIESNEYRFLVDDRHGGVYERTVAAVITAPHVDRVVVRRPQHVDHDEVLASAYRFLAEQPAYSMSGVLFAGVLVALGQSWTERAIDRVLGEGHSEALERRFADVVADGTARLVCAELVYRVLNDAHVPLTHDALFLAAAIRHVATLAPTPGVDALANDATPADGAISVERLARLIQASHRTPEEAGSESALARLGWPTFLRLTGRQIKRDYERRLTEIGDGDLADLITPRDFLEMQPFNEMLDVHWHRGHWVN